MLSPIHQQPSPSQTTHAENHINVREHLSLRKWSPEAIRVFESQPTDTHFDILAKACEISAGNNRGDPSTLNQALEVSEQIVLEQLADDRGFYRTGFLLAESCKCGRHGAACQPLTEPLLKVALPQIPEWTVKADRLSREFHFDHYLSGSEFIDAIARYGERVRHHGRIIEFEWVNEGAVVTVETFTRHINFPNISTKDIMFALYVDELKRVKN